MSTRADMVRHAAAVLQQAGLEEAAREARLLCAAVLQLDRAALLAHDDAVLTPHEQALFDVALARRAQHEPLARIVGLKEFWGLPFALNRATLVPRPESETLIETVRRLVPDRRRPLRVLDLGTGSGCLLLALLHDYPMATGVGLDCAPAAVAQARHNAATLGIASRADFCLGDWRMPDWWSVFNALPEAGRFDLIVTNPPYIATATVPTLDRAVRDYDPQLALDGGADGLEAYRCLVVALPHLRAPDGFVLFEIGYDQAQTVTALVHAHAAGVIDLVTDWAGRPRCVTLSAAPCQPS